MVVFGGLSSIYFWIVHWLYTVFASTARSHFLVNAYIAFDEDVLIGNPETDLHLAILLNQMAWWPVLVLPFTLMLLYFPEGKLLSPRWRIVINATVLSLVFGMITTFHPRPDKEWGITEPNPAGIKGSERLLERLAIIYMALFFIAVFFQHLRGSVTAQRKPAAVRRER